jgi:hypothetical protein
MASSLLAFFLACCFCAGVALADGDTAITLPSTYRDDIYHCANPTDDRYVIPCDSTTFRWRLDDLYPSNQPDDSILCQEIVKILVRAKEQEQLDAGQLQVQDQTQNDVQLWETVMETSVVDRLEPCVLWALSYGPLTSWASSMGFDENDHKFLESGQSTHIDINDNSGEWKRSKECNQQTSAIFTHYLLPNNYVDSFILTPNLAWIFSFDFPLSIRSHLVPLGGRVRPHFHCPCLGHGLAGSPRTGPDRAP